MKSIKSKDTSIELKLRKELWSRGCRYRKNYAVLPGKPDIVFLSKKVAVFCDSEFWHGRGWESKKQKIRSNREYWIPKIERNIERDKAINKELGDMGFLVLRFWGDEISKDTAGVADKIVEALSSTEKQNPTNKLVEKVIQHK